jgi:Domain of Unknown Function (DUF1206)
VRTGFVARGITYGLIGGIALALAVGAGSEPVAPNQQGSLALIAQAPLGRLAIAGIAAGLFAFALWKFVQALHGRGPEGGGGADWKDRVANASGGVAYLLFCVVAVRVLVHSAGNSSTEPSQAAAGVLGWPGGPALVGAAAAALIAISAYQIFDAVRGSFADDSKIEEMNDTSLHVFMLLGLIGLIARALVFGLIGYFLLRTAIEFKPSNTVGVDGALAAVHRQPYGPWLLGLVAGGLLTFAAFSLLEARYRRL